MRHRSRRARLSKAQSFRGAAQASMPCNRRHQALSDTRVAILETLSFRRSSAGRMTWHRAATLHFSGPCPVLALQDIESLDGVTIVVEADRTTQSFEVLKLDEIVADFDPIRFQVFRFAGHACILGG